MRAVGLVVSLTAAITVGFFDSAPAGLDEEWFENQFNSGNAVPITPGAKPSISKDESLKQRYLEAIVRFNKLTFLPADEAKNYSQNMQRLVGSFGYFEASDEGQNIVLIGRNTKDQNISVELKDTIVFKGVVKKGFNAGLKLPILTVDAGQDDLAELTIEDIGVVQSNLSIVEWTCKFPLSYYADAWKKPFFYIEAATATKITKKYFQKEEQKGGLLYSILNFSGKRYFSNEQTEATKTISISARPVRLVTQDPFSEEGQARLKRFCTEQGFVSARSVDKRSEPPLPPENLQGVILKKVRLE